MNTQTSAIILDEDRQLRAKHYGRIRRRLMLVDLAFGAAYLLCWLAFGWSTALRNALLSITNNDWLLVAGFGMVFSGIYLLIGMPLAYYSGYVLPHRFGLSNQRFRGWVSDQVKGLLISAILAGLLLEIIYAMLRAFPQSWWIITAGILLVFSVLLTNLAPVLLMPLFFKFTPLEKEYADLENRLLNLAARAGTNVRGVYKFDMSRRTKAANAALTGLGNTRRILLGDTLLQEFTHDEIETVLAHELAHHVYKDIPIGILIESALTLIGLYLAAQGLNWGIAVFNFNSPADVAALPLLGIVLGLFSLVTMPLTNLYSRWRERRADEYSLEATRNGTAFASALTRLANQNLAEVNPEPWVEFLLYSHPALGKRIAMAERYTSSTTQASI